MKFCENRDDGTLCNYCGECGVELCTEKTNTPCDGCGYCQ